MSKSLWQGQSIHKKNLSPQNSVSVPHETNPQIISPNENFPIRLLSWLFLDLKSLTQRKSASGQQNKTKTETFLVRRLEGDPSSQKHPLLQELDHEDTFLWYNSKIQLPQENLRKCNWPKSPCSSPVEYPVPILRVA